MSLRDRVIAVVALMLVVSVGIYVVISWGAARRDLAAELGSARTGGLQTVRSSFEDLPRSGHQQRDLRQLVGTFDGNRHLVAAVVDLHGRERMISRPALPNEPVPQWFSASLTPDLGASRAKVPDRTGDVFVLRPEPASDIAARWSSAVNAARVFATATLVAFALIYWIIGRALAPLSELSSGLRAIGASGSRERVEIAGPRELHPLQRGFNAMAERLAQIDERNRALEAQLLTIQDEERADIARDLHDEIGPHLFAVALDAEMIGQCFSSGRTEAIPDQVRSIQSAVSYMQRQVRELIARLRPTRAAELGLQAAVDDLVAFWQSRQPDLRFLTKVDEADANVPEHLRDVIYRVVQESVANALRHAQTAELAIDVSATADEIVASVKNQGKAKPNSSSTPGLGLVSMRERVQDAGGTLEVETSPGGWKVSARFRPSLEKFVA